MVHHRPRQHVHPDREAMSTDGQRLSPDAAPVQSGFARSKRAFIPALPSISQSKSLPHSDEHAAKQLIGFLTSVSPSSRQFEVIQTRNQFCFRQKHKFPIYYPEISFRRKYPFTTAHIPRPHLPLEPMILPRSSHARMACYPGRQSPQDDDICYVLRDCPRLCTLNLHLCNAA
ncbi:hypothetical protein PHLGIDRAFT_231247 [Phlebiopsis gigantea 11061_1 CR5-6]|uniref:Uncharacterized protein n=1 Tax=Phlebiopsis gigantea (strain 11061_1 CR5-6) TaxID=745531 RepID=A0A0C3SC01_PHLG1|nr:hypothetical protein PHLGIDRAFT_231247 [Phlebiopsis gigantea 11061_1 CR5-6]